MNAPRYDNYWSPTTILAAVNLAILVFGGGAAYATLRQETISLREADLRHEVTMEQMRIDAAAGEARLRVVENGAGRMETQLDNIAQAIERLTVQVERALDGNQIRP